MPDSPILDGGPRFPEVITVRVPEGFVERVRQAAEREGISPRDFTRRAIADRLARSTYPGDAPATPAPQTAET